MWANCYAVAECRKMVERLDVTCCMRHAFRCERFRKHFAGYTYASLVETRRPHIIAMVAFGTDAGGWMPSSPIN